MPCRRGMDRAGEPQRLACSIFHRQRPADMLSFRPLAPSQVLAVGDEVKLQVKAGDFVVFQKYAMAEVGGPAGYMLLRGAVVPHVRLRARAYPLLGSSTEDLLSSLLLP